MVEAIKYLANRSRAQLDCNCWPRLATAEASIFAGTAVLTECLIQKNAVGPSAAVSTNRNSSEDVTSAQIQRPRLKPASVAGPEFAVDRNPKRERGIGVFFPRRALADASGYEAKFHLTALVCRTRNGTESLNLFSKIAYCAE